MKNWRNTVISPDSSVRDAIKTINEGGFEIAIVTEVERTLLGTITDGDIRRGILGGLGMDAPAAEIMNRDPLVLGHDTKPDQLLQKMNEAVIRQIPLLDPDGQLVGLCHIRDLTQPIETRENWVVLMAGGLGERLRPLTDERPKPLLSVGDKPILEATLERFVEQNFARFYISVNYKADAIKDHFGDGGKWGVEIRYLEEDRRLGTAGALALMTEIPDTPFIVMNGDLLTQINFQDLLDYHDQENASATMCVRQYDIQVPFGIVEINGNRVKSVDEKPVQRVFVNAGIYVLDPDLVSLVPADTHYDMTELFEDAIAAAKDAKVFPLHEYWLDVGHIDDLEKGKREFKSVFGE